MLHTVGSARALTKVFCLAMMCMTPRPSAAAAPATSRLAPRISSAGGAATQPISSSLQQCTDLMLQSVAHAERTLPQTSSVADAVAARWIAGAGLFVGGDPSFSDEVFYRAGGLIGLRRIGPARKSNGRTVPLGEVPKESIVLYGLHRNADANLFLFEELARLASDQDTIVLFASRDWPITQKVLQSLGQHLQADKVLLIDTHLPVDTRLRTKEGMPFGSYAGMGTAVHAWTFMAELIAACTRQGKMPGVWPSLTIPRYEIWEKKYETISFHDDFTIQPIDPGVLGTQYLRTLRQQLQACPASTGQVKAAGHLLAAVPAGKTVYVMIEGHLLPGETSLPMELANWIPVQRSWRWKQAASTLGQGDAILWLGYLTWPDAEAQDAAQHGNPFVGVSVRAPGRHEIDEPLITPGVPASQAATTAPDAARTAPIPAEAPTPTPSELPANAVWVHAPWQYPDSVVQVPGYPVKACPTSGIVQGTILWGLIGEAMQQVDR